MSRTSDSGFTNSPRRLRILLSAYYCSPYRGSESAVGWQTAIGLARYHDVTVICGDLSPAAPTAADLERYRSEKGLPEGLEIVHVQAKGLERLVHCLHRLPGCWFLYYEAYRRWQHRVLSVSRELHSRTAFHLVHHVNIVGYREPGYLWQLGIPFFWGPVSGAPLIPRSFLSDFGWKERFRWGTRNVLNRWQSVRASRPQLAARSATKIWAVSEEDREMLKAWGVGAELMLEGGSTNPVREMRIRDLPSGATLKICWSGLFQGIKALPLLLRALARMDGRRVWLDILGDGPEGKRWKALAADLGLEDRVKWHGMLPRNEALSIMEESHVLVHTSIKEATATVLVEGLERGLPVICHDACGMGVAIDDRCGLRVPLRDPATSVEGFHAALRRLLEEQGLLARLSQGAFLRAKELSWQSKLEKISSAYLSAIQG